MKKILFAAITAGVLGLAAAPVANADSVRIGVGHHGLGIKIGPDHRWNNGWKRGWHKNRCRMVPVWRNHHQYWVRRCW